jgi:hypothetical protein
VPSLAPPTNETGSLDYRVHSYLAANCVHCHQPGGTGRGNFDLRLTVPLRTSGLINGAPVETPADPADLVIKPGSLENSVLFARLTNSGASHMPPLTATLQDSQAIALFSAWITNRLAHYQSFADWQLAYFGSTNFANATNLLEYLTGANPLLPGDSWTVGLGMAAAQPTIHFAGTANLAFEVQWTTNISGGVPWQALDVPENVPVFSVTNWQGSMPDLSPGASDRFYRVRILEP